MPSTQYHAPQRSARAIAENLEREIDAGVYRGGGPLPTIRALADELGVSPTTVNAAFAMLRAQGRIVGKRRGGSIVVAQLPLQSATLAPAPAIGRDLAVANPDPAFLPPLKAVLGRLAGTPRLYTDIVDCPELLAYSRAQFEADGIDSSEAGIAAGALDAIERALGAMTVPGDFIALEDPGYPPYAALAHALGLRVVRMPVDASGITPDGLSAAIKARSKAIVIVPRAHNPTGVSIDAPRARALRSLLAAAPDVAVVEDDFLAMLCGVELHSLTPGRKRWLNVRSLAKTIGPDVRVAPYAADALTRSRIAARQRVGYGWVSTLLQETAIGVLRSASARKSIGAAKVAYAQRRRALLAACARHGLQASGPGGFTVWIYVPDEAAAIRSAQAAGFAIDGGARYRVDSPSAVRVTITTLMPGEAEALASAIASAASPYP